MNIKKYEFEAEIRKVDGMDAGYILFPYQVEEEFGTKGQVKVQVVFDGKIEYRGSLAKMGMEQHCLGITKQIRKLIQKQPGDRVRVSLHADLEPRIVQIPRELQVELAKGGMESVFRALSFTKQKEMAALITNAAKEETRKRRLHKIIEQLSKMI